MSERGSESRGEIGELNQKKAQQRRQGGAVRSAVLVDTKEVPVDEGEAQDVGDSVPKEAQVGAMEPMNQTEGDTDSPALTEKERALIAEHLESKERAENAKNEVQANLNELKNLEEHVNKKAGDDLVSHFEFKSLLGDIGNNLNELRTLSTLDTKKIAEIGYLDNLKKAKEMAEKLRRIGEALDKDNRQEAQEAPQVETAETPLVADLGKSELAKASSAESAAEVKELSSDTRQKLAFGLSNASSYIKGKKSQAAAYVLDMANKALFYSEEKSETGKDIYKEKTESGWANGVARRFLESARKIYAKEYQQSIVDSKASTSKLKTLSNAGTLAGNIFRVGRVVTDIVGYTAAAPFRYGMMIAMGATKGLQISKEAHLMNEAVWSETRVANESEAAEQAWAIYEKAMREQGIEEKREEYDSNADIVPDTNVAIAKKLDGRALRDAYLDNLPNELIARLEKSSIDSTNPKVDTELTLFQHFLNGYVRGRLENINDKLGVIEASEQDASQKKAEQTKVLNSYAALLEDYDRLTSRVGVIDVMAISLRGAESAGKAVTGLLTAQSLVLAAEKLWDIGADRLYKSNLGKFSLNTKVKIPKINPFDWFRSGTQTPEVEPTATEAEPVKDSSPAVTIKVESAPEAAPVVPPAESVELEPESEAPAVLTPEYEYQGGESVWEEARLQFEARFKAGFASADLDAAERTFLIDKVKDIVHDNPGKYGIGDVKDADVITSEQLARIDWDKAFADAGIEQPEDLEDLTKDLTSDEKAQITKNNQKIEDWRQEFPDSRLDTEQVEKILNGDADGVQDSNDAPKKADAVPNQVQPESAPTDMLDNEAPAAEPARAEAAAVTSEGVKEAQPAINREQSTEYTREKLSEEIKKRKVFGLFGRGADQGTLRGLTEILAQDLGYGAGDRHDERVFASWLAGDGNVLDRKDFKDILFTDGPNKGEVDLIKFSAKYLEFEKAANSKYVPEDLNKWVPRNVTYRNGDTEIANIKYLGESGSKKFYYLDTEGYGNPWSIPTQPDQAYYFNEDQIKELLGYEQVQTSDAGSETQVETDVAAGDVETAGESWNSDQKKYLEKHIDGMINSLEKKTGVGFDTDLQADDFRKLKASDFDFDKLDAETTGKMIKLYKEALAGNVPEGDKVYFRKFVRLAEASLENR